MLRKQSFSIALIATLLALVTPHVARAAGGVRRPSPAETSRRPIRAFVRLELGQNSLAHGLYVGQAVPVTVRAYFLNGTGVTLNGSPRMVSDGFTLSDVADKPRQTETEFGGLPYTELVWTGVLTAVKATATSPAIELPTSLSYVEPSSTQTSSAGGEDDGGEDPMKAFLAQTPFASDPFFARMFKGRDPFAGIFNLGGEAREQEVTLRDQARRVVVGDLPEPRPPGFTGAVGSFEPTAAIAEHELRVGEPTTFTLTVRGSGTFPRLATTGLPSTAELRTYGVNSKFAPSQNPLAGEMVFTQTIVPTRAGALTIPPVAIAYFDPQKGRYVRRETAPISANVAAAAGGPIDSLASSAAAAAPATSAAPRQQPIGEDVYSSLAPVFRTALYWWLVAAIVGGAAVLSAIGWARSSPLFQRVSRSRARRRQIAAHKRDIDRAAASGDAAAMFAAARAAAQATLAARWRIPAEAISSADIDDRLGPSGARVRELFENADRLAYVGDGTRTTKGLDRLRGSLLSELRVLEKTP